MAFTLEPLWVGARTAGTEWETGNDSVVWESLFTLSGT